MLLAIQRFYSLIISVVVGEASGIWNLNSSKEFVDRRRVLDLTNSVVRKENTSNEEFQSLL